MIEIKGRALLASIKFCALPRAAGGTGVERALINRYGCAKNGGQQPNKMNSVATSNPLYGPLTTFNNFCGHWIFWMKQGVKIGDVLEVRTSRGLAYVQYTHYQKPLGALIRVLPGFHQSRPADWAQLAKTKELYFVFCPIETLVDQGLLLVASNEPVPDSAAHFPAMRHRGFVRPVAKGGGVSHWTIVEDQKEYRVAKLTPAQARLSIASSWNLGMLVERLTEGWLPEMDLGLPLADRHLAQPKDDVGIQHVRHFLYFPTEAKARQIQQRLSARVFTLEVKPAAIGSDWLLLVSDRWTTEESFTQTRTEHEELAVQFNGEYDGWELDSARS